MAVVCYGAGTSHTPQISMPPEMWPVHSGLVDRRMIGDDEFDARVARSTTAVKERAVPEVWQEQHARVQESIAQLAAELTAAAPDVVVVIGDDQREWFLDVTPMFGVYCGEALEDGPEDREVSEPMRAAAWARHASEPTTFSAAPVLGEHLVRHLVERGFDPAVVSRQPVGLGVGHAFTFPRLRLLQERPEVPILPVFVNTYYPPNQPSAARCWDLGVALREAIEAFPDDLRVAVVASGGLSHFVVDDTLDRTVLAAIEAGDEATLRAISQESLQLGSSEILNWIAAAGCLQGLHARLISYDPVYRSLAGTGVGVAFLSWQA